MLKTEHIVRRKTSGLMLAAAFAAVAATSAYGADSTFEMTVIRDAAFGSKIEAGEFDAAIEGIRNDGIRPSEQFFAKNNLCVAYTMAAEFDKAAVACDAAISIAKEDLSIENDGGFNVMSVSVAGRYYAMALTNRGVLRAMVGEPGEARTDFEAAKGLRAGIGAPVRNLRYLDARKVQASID